MKKQALIASGIAFSCALAVPMAGYFSAIGNQALLNAPVIWQVQCSRSWFEYRRAQWLAGSGATEIQYRGVEPARIDELAAAAVKLAVCTASAQSGPT